MTYLTPLQAIKKKCKEDCCAGNNEAWKECHITKCYLHPYRFGKRVNVSSNKVTLDKKYVDSPNIIKKILEKQNILNKEVENENL